jgi:hypothetical protein
MVRVLFAFLIRLPFEVSVRLVPGGWDESVDAPE